MFTIFFTVIAIAVTIALTGCAGIMAYAKGCTDEVKENMGIRI